MDKYGISSIGYAIISNKLQIIERSNHPILTPDYDWETFGCEDPRITRIDNTYYMLYTAYSRRGPRIALATSSKLTNFTKIGLVGPDLNDKDAAFFPQLVNGKFAFIHRVEPSIQIAYFNLEDLEKIADVSVMDRYWAQHLNNLDAHTIMKPEKEWEVKKIGLGPPPIRTPDGWLIIYHGVDYDKVYRAGAALADLNDPSKILARSRTPILCPEQPYEIYGYVPNVVFPQAAMVVDGTLYVFYGAADKLCCLATTSLDELLEWLFEQPQ